MTPQSDTTDVRLTVRLSSDLYARLAIFAKGRNHGGIPQLSQIVREALEHYLSPEMCQTTRIKKVAMSDKQRR